MSGKIVVLGAGGHARSVIDAVLSAGAFEVVGFTEVAEVAPYRGVARIGSDGDLRTIRGGADAAAIGLGFMGGSGEVRERAVSAAREAGFSFPPVIDPTAAVAGDARIAEGAFVGKGAVVNSAARIGPFCIVNSGAVVEHDCVVGAWSHVSVNAAVCGGARIGEGAFVGAGAVVIQGVSVGERCVVGANATVLADVPDGRKVVGVFNGK